MPNTSSSRHPEKDSRDSDRVLIHGSTGSTWMRRLATGVDASVAVTSLDAVIEGLIPGRAAEVRPSTARELAAAAVLTVPGRTP